MPPARTPSGPRVQPPWSTLRGAGLSLLLLTGMAGAETALPPLTLPDPMPSPPETVLLPVPDHRVAAAVASLDALGADTLARSGIPGLAITVVHRGQTVYAKGFGLRAVDGAAPVDADTVFLLASLSKPVGATVIASQIGKNGVAWDSPVRDFLPWFDLGDDWVSAHVTIGDLYAHRAGLPDHAGDDLEDLGYDRRTVLERLALLPMGQFRVDYAYTNFGLTAAAEAVATAAGTDWAILSEQAIYAPLGMASTSSRHADFMARENRASSHVPAGDGFRVADLRLPDAQSPAGGVSSSAHDMARWMAMVLAGGGQVVSEQALLPALTPQAISGPPPSVRARGGSYGYGFGIGIRPSGRVVLSHSGAFALGASTSVAMIPDLDLGIVVLTNANPTGAAEAITSGFLDRVEIGIDSRDWLDAYGPRMAGLSAPTGDLRGAAPPRDPAPAAANAAYAGQYDNPYFGAATVEAGPDGLTLLLGPAPVRLPMAHWTGDAFLIHPLTENQPEGSVSLVEFMLDPAGQAKAMRIEHLDKLGLGHFRRGN